VRTFSNSQSRTRSLCATGGAARQRAGGGSLSYRAALLDNDIILTFAPRLTAHIFPFIPTQTPFILYIGIDSLPAGCARDLTSNARARAEPLTPSSLR
jgi:hypothetical protein